MLRKFKLRTQHFLFFCCALCAVAAVVLVTGSSSADALYVLTDANNSIPLDGTHTESTISQRLVTVTGADQASPNIQLKSGQPVLIRYHDAQLSTVSQEESLSALLARMNIVPGPLELIGVDGSGSVIQVTVSSRLVCYESEAENLPHGVQYVNRYDQPAGYENVLSQGCDGTARHIYEVIYEDGERLSRQLVETVTEEAEPMVVERGSLVTEARVGDSISSVVQLDDGSGYLLMASGDSLHYSKTLSVTATAYTVGYDGVDTCTATGTTVREGCIAVDRKVIALGSNLVVSTSAGTYVGKAEDTGVKGKKVDLYMDSYRACILFGRRSGTVYVLD